MVFFGLNLCKTTLFKNSLSVLVLGSEEGLLAGLVLGTSPSMRLLLLCRAQTAHELLGGGVWVGVPGLQH